MKNTLEGFTDVRADELYFQKLGNAGWRLYAVIPEEGDRWKMYFRWNPDKRYVYEFPSATASAPPAELLKTYWEEGWDIAAAYSRNGMAYFYLVREI